MKLLNVLTQFYFGDSVFVIFSFAVLILILSFVVYIGFKLYRKFTK